MSFYYFNSYKSDIVIAFVIVIVLLVRVLINF